MEISGTLLRSLALLCPCPSTHFLLLPLANEERLFSYNVMFRSTTTPTSGRQFPVPTEFSQYERVVSSGRPAISCIFVTIPLTLFPFTACFLKGHTKCPKDYDSPRGLCIGQISDFPRVGGLRHFDLARNRGSHAANHQRSLQLVARQSSWKFYFGRDRRFTFNGHVSSQTLYNSEAKMMNIALVSCMLCGILEFCLLSGEIWYF